MGRSHRDQQGGPEGDVALLAGHGPPLSAHPSQPTPAGPHSIATGLSRTVATNSTITPHPGHLLQEQAVRSEQQQQQLWLEGHDPVTGSQRGWGRPGLLLGKEQRLLSDPG